MSNITIKMGRVTTKYMVAYPIARAVEILISHCSKGQLQEYKDETLEETKEEPLKEYLLSLPSCNNCGRKTDCPYIPLEDDPVRINCVYWKDKEDEDGSDDILLRQQEDLD